MFGKERLKVAQADPTPTVEREFSLRSQSSITDIVRFPALADPMRAPTAWCYGNVVSLNGKPTYVELCVDVAAQGPAKKSN